MRLIHSSCRQSFPAKLYCTYSGKLLYGSFFLGYDAASMGKLVMFKYSFQNIKM